MTQEELKALLADVEADLSLRKSMPLDEEQIMEEDAEQAPDQEMPAEEMEMEPSDDQAMDPEAQAQAEAADAEMGEEESMDPALAEEQQMGEEEPSIEEIYASMDEAELAHHFEAIQQAMQQVWKKEHDASDKEAPVKKDEMLSTEANGKLPMMKSESVDVERLSKALSDQQAYIKQLETGLEDLTGALTKSVPAPTRKSITDINVVKKSEGDEDFETLAKSEEQIFAEAGKFVRRQDLTKTERNVLNAYFIDRTQVAPVRELLKAKK